MFKFFTILAFFILLTFLETRAMADELLPSKNLKKPNDFSQVDLGEMKRPTKPAEKTGYFLGLSPRFKWKGAVSITGMTFEKVVSTKSKKPALLGIKEDGKDFEIHLQYGQVVELTDVSAAKLRQRILSTALDISAGKVKNVKLKKSIIDEDPALDLSRFRPLGEWVYFVPVKDCPDDFRRKAFVTWEPKMMIKALEPALV
jgi:hypothetical protein